MSQAHYVMMVAKVSLIMLLMLPMANNVMSPFGGQDILFIQPLSSSTLSMTDACGAAGDPQCLSAQGGDLVWSLTVCMCSWPRECVHVCSIANEHVFPLVCSVHLGIWTFSIAQFVCILLILLNTAPVCQAYGV